MSDRLTLLRPDDWHIHLRDGAALANTVGDAARTFGRAIVMPNLVPPVRNAAEADAYRQRILAARPAASRFEPLMVLYLTDRTSAEEIRTAKASGFVHAAKLYPAGATTNSDSGVTRIDNIFEALEAMAEVGMPLLVHGEVTRAEVDVFDREKQFIDEHLRRVVERFPTLKVVFEHITTGDAAQFVREAPANVGATITAHHLLYNRNHMLVGGIRPHFYCLPILKRNTHQEALLDAAVSGNPKFFLGTDSAPHARHAKEAACGCAGCYSAYAAIELYAEAFEQRNALDKLEGFASLHGPDFYGLPRNTDRITLVREEWQAPASLPFGDFDVVPLRAGETLRWKLLEAGHERRQLRRRIRRQPPQRPAPSDGAPLPRLPAGSGGRRDRRLQLGHRRAAGNRRDHCRHGRERLPVPGTHLLLPHRALRRRHIEPAALEFTGIKLDHPLRMAVQEEAALTEIFRGIRKALKANGCKRAILVGHNSSFDLGFLNAAVARTGIKRNPFHPFSSFDTATLAGLAYGQTVLAKACQAAGMEFDNREAHSARYDTEKTAELFCGIVNRWKEMGGWMDDDD